MVTKMVTKMVFKTRAWARPGLQNMAPAYCFAKPGPFLSSRYLVGREKIKKKNVRGRPLERTAAHPPSKKKSRFSTQPFKYNRRKVIFFLKGGGLLKAAFEGLDKIKP